MTVDCNGSPAAWVAGRSDSAFHRKCGLIEKIAWNELDSILKMIDPFEVDRAATTYQTVDLVVLLQQKLSQVRPILTCDSCD